MKNMNLLLIIILLYLCFCCLLNKTKYIKKVKKITNLNLDLVEPTKLNILNKLKVFTYIEEPSNYNKEQKLHLYNFENMIPYYLFSCIKIMKKNINNLLYELVILTPQNISDYLDDFPIIMNGDSEYSLKYRVDLLSSFILSKYGGLFLSPGTIIYKNMNNIIDKISNYDMVTFGSSKLEMNICDNKLYPNNYIIGCKKDSLYMNKYKRLLLNEINDPKPYSGLRILPKILNCSNIKQLHFSCEYDGTIDYNNKLIGLNSLLGTYKILFKNEKKLLFISLPYDIILKNTKYEWVNLLNKDELLNSNIFLGNILRIKE